MSNDFIGLDWHPSLIEEEEMRRERASLARMVAVLMLVLCFAGAWSCAHQVFGSSAQLEIPFGDAQGESARLKQVDGPPGWLSGREIFESQPFAARAKDTR